MTDILLIGECMVELSLEGPAAAAIGYAGDTFNTAVYLSRLGASVAYATAIGKGDPFSMGMLALMDAEGVAHDLVVEVEGRLPGLYAIERDPMGERRFFYWRDSSPARELMARVDDEALSTTLDQVKLAYVSGISLAILDAAGRGALNEALGRAPAVAFDTNYRPQLWPDAATAREAVEAVASFASTISTSTQDLQGLGLEPEETARRWAGQGAEVVLRRQSHDIEVWLAGDRQPFAAEPPVAAVDSTGAGDSFNAAYLAARLAGQPIEAAILRGRRLANAVVQHRGAIIPKVAMPAL